MRFVIVISLGLFDQWNVARLWPWLRSLRRSSHLATAVTLKAVRHAAASLANGSGRHCLRRVFSTLMADPSSTKWNLVLFAQTLGIDECPRLARGIVPVLTTNSVALFRPFPQRRRSRRWGKGGGRGGVVAGSGDRETPPGRPGASKSVTSHSVLQTPSIPFGASSCHVSLLCLPRHRLVSVTYIIISGFEAKVFEGTARSTRIESTSPGCR